MLGFGITAGGMGERSRHVCVECQETSVTMAYLGIMEDKTRDMILGHRRRRIVWQRAKARTLTILIGQPS